MSKWKSKHSGRTLTVIGDEAGIRYFTFDDCSHINAMAQHPINQWNDYFCII